MGVIVPIESAFFALFVGLANASAVMVGRSLGCDRQDEAWQLYKIFDRLTIGLVVALALLLWFARPWMLSAFGQVEEATASLLRHTLTVFCLLI